MSQKNNVEKAGHKHKCLIFGYSWLYHIGKTFQLIWLKRVIFFILSITKYNYNYCHILKNDSMLNVKKLTGNVKKSCFLRCVFDVIRRSSGLIELSGWQAFQWDKLVHLSEIPKLMYIIKQKWY